MLRYQGNQRSVFIKHYKAFNTFARIIYFLGGNIAISQITIAVFMAFSKDIFEEYFKDVNIYELADNCEQTFGRLYELLSQVHVDTNSSGMVDETKALFLKGKNFDEENSNTDIGNSYAACLFRRKRVC